MLKKKLLKMSSSSSHKAFALIALLFLLSATGISRKLMTDDGFALPPSLFEESNGESREMAELDYVDAGPNTNNRSSFNPPTPNPEAPTPQP